jgi:hypothetical protein
MVNILSVFEEIKEYTLESIRNAEKAGKSHDPWTDTGLGYDAGWINNELGRAQMFLLAARPELSIHKVRLLDMIGENVTTQDILDEMNAKDQNYIQNLFKVFDFFATHETQWCSFDLKDQSKIDQIKKII